MGHILENFCPGCSTPGPVANSQCVQSSNVHAGAGDAGDPDVTMEESIRDVNKATQEIKVMQDMLRAIPPGELVDVRANIEAKIAAAKRDITSQLSACIATLERATARRNKAGEVLVKASRDVEFAREEVTRLVSEKSRMEQSVLSTQSAPSC